MYFGIEKRCLGLATVLVGAAFFFMPIQVLAMDSPFNQARAVVQEMLGEAITSGALAQTGDEKGRAQEKMGFAIFNLALIALEEPKQMFVPMDRRSFSPNPEKVQEMLGEAIMAAVWAETYSERTWSQEVLGLLIVNETLLSLREFPIGMGGETEAVITGP